VGRRALLAFVLIIAGVGGATAHADGPVNTVSDHIPGIGRVSNAFIGYCPSYGPYGSVVTKLAFDFVGHLQHGQDPNGHNYFIRSGHASGVKFCTAPGEAAVHLNLVEQTPTGRLTSDCYGDGRKEIVRWLPTQTARDLLPPTIRIELTCDEVNSGRQGFYYLMHVTLLQRAIGTNGIMYRGYVQTDLGWCVDGVTCLQELP